MKRRRLQRIGEMPSHQFKLEDRKQKSQKASDFSTLEPISATLSHLFKPEHHERLFPETMGFTA